MYPQGLGKIPDTYQESKLWMDEWTQENFNDSSQSEHFFKVILYQIRVVATRDHK